MKHLAERQDLRFAGQLTRHESMSQHDIHRGAQVQAKVRRDVKETMAQTPRYLRNPAVFRAENVNPVFGVLESRQGFAPFEDFDTHRRETLKKFNDRSVFRKCTLFISLHPLFARQAFVSRNIEARTGPYQRRHTEARAGSDRRANVMGKLWIGPAQLPVLATYLPPSPLEN